MRIFGAYTKFCACTNSFFRAPPRNFSHIPTYNNIFVYVYAHSLHSRASYVRKALYVSCVARVHHRIYLWPRYAFNIYIDTPSHIGCHYVIHVNDGARITYAKTYNLNLNDFVNANCECECARLRQANTQKSKFSSAFGCDHMGPILHIAHRWKFCRHVTSATKHICLSIPDSLSVSISLQSAWACNADARALA